VRWVDPSVCEDVINAHMKEPGTHVKPWVPNTAAATRRYKPIVVAQHPKARREARAALPAWQQKELQEVARKNSHESRRRNKERAA
jgi:hypothetical protein